MTQVQLSWADLAARYLPPARSVMLVSGKTSLVASGAKSKLDQALGGQPYVHFTDFTENPQLDDVSTGVDRLKAGGCDLIIAVGGGSAMDMAKSIHLLADQPAGDHAAIVAGNIALGSKPGGGRSLIAVPTTFGTGSESTHFAVVYIGDDKYSLAHAEGMPAAYILDPDLGLPAPAAVRATTGTDALCQAIESYWSVGGTEESRAYAADAITLIRNNLETFVTVGTADSARAMAKAANLAGRAINITKTTAPHALSYAITKLYGVPHGQAVALSLPYFFVHNAERGDAAARGRMNDLFAFLGVVDGRAAADWFRALMLAIGQKARLGDIAVLDDTTFDMLARKVNAERLANHPVRVTHEDLVAAIKGQP